MKGNNFSNLISPSAFNSGGGTDANNPFVNIAQGSGGGGGPSFGAFGQSDVLQNSKAFASQPTQGQLDPFSLVSNLLENVDPNQNPGISGALRALFQGEFGGEAANSLLRNNIAPSFAEGLETGFKPDLQPVIDEASRAFFSEIVPQLGQNNVALQQGVGPFSSDLNAGLLNAGGALASQLGALEVENQNRAGDRRGELLGLSGLITDQLFNSSVNAGRNRLDLGSYLLGGTSKLLVVVCDSL